MKRLLCLAAGSLALAACDKAETPPPAPQPKAEKAPHCFFKEAETEGWRVTTGKDGQAVVSGRAFRSDARYKAVLLDSKIEGRVAVVRPSIELNDTGFAAEGNWWDLKTAIPAGSVDTVEVRCGKKVLASLPLAKEGA